MNQTKFEMTAVPYLSEDQAMAASIGDNRAMWLKFIFTDDQPNENKQGVSQDEFDNIIITGRHKPFKKTLGDLEGHPGAVPIGTIAELTKEDNHIVGIASVWEEEFPEDAMFIREAYAQKFPLNVSWEVFYQDSEYTEDGVEWLKGVSTRGVTLVANPAYGGRTPILAVAEQTQEGGTNMDELETLKQEKATLEADAQTLREQLDALQLEVESLRTYKNDVESQKARSELMKRRLTRFQEVGLEKTEAELESEADQWLGMSDDAFEFVLSTLVKSAKPKGSEASASVNEDEDAVDENGDAVSLVRKFLTERKNK